MEGDPDHVPADREPFTITPVRVGPATVVAIVGEIDLATGPHLRAELGDVIDGLADADARILVLDLTAVTFLGSTGLAVLVDVNWQACEQGVALRVVVGSRSRVARAIQAAGIDELLETHPDLGAALDPGTS